MKLPGRRFDWQPWRWSSRSWVIALAVLIGFAPLITRWICLWQIFDVRLPFDIDELRSRSVPDSQNAFLGYVEFQRMLVKADFGSLERPSSALANPVLPTFDDSSIEQWLVNHQDLLAAFERTTQMRSSLAEPLNRMVINSLVPLLRELPKQINLIQAEAARCERSGDFQRAWEWHLACLRCGRHIEMNGYAVSAGQGRRIRFETYEGIARWAAHPEISVSQLRQARKDLLIDHQASRLHSEILKFEYVLSLNSLASFDGPEILFGKWSQSWQFVPASKSVENAFLWTTGEPELSLRLLRQVLVNQLQQIDKPPHLRPEPIRREYPAVFALDPTMPLQPGQLSPHRLAQLLKEPVGQRLIREQAFSNVGPSPTDVYDLDHQLDSDQTHADLIAVVLAAHEFQRIHGEFPHQLDELIPTFLDRVPIDELNPSRAPLRYRYSGSRSALVWSVGHDGTDDDGNISPNAGDEVDRGYRLLIKSERTLPSKE